MMFEDKTGISAPDTLAYNLVFHTLIITLTHPRLRVPVVHSEIKSGGHRHGSAKVRLTTRRYDGADQDRRRGSSLIYQVGVMINVEVKVRGTTTTVTTLTRTLNLTVTITLTSIPPEPNHNPISLCVCAHIHIGSSSRVSKKMFLQNTFSKSGSCRDWRTSTAKYVNGWIFHLTRRATRSLHGCQYRLMAVGRFFFMWPTNLKTKARLAALHTG